MTLLENNFMFQLDHILTTSTKLTGLFFPVEAKPLPEKLNTNWNLGKNEVI